jgi:uncharacterized protein (TIGR02246 family)
MPVDPATPASVDLALRDLHQRLLGCWDRRDAAGYAALFTDDALVIGFDGSEMAGRAAIERQLAAIFSRHQPPVYVRLVRSVRSVRLLAPGVAALHAVVGMAREGQPDLLPGVDAAQSLVAVERPEDWRIALFQNTPAAYHGRPEASANLRVELAEEFTRRRGFP